MINNLHMYLTLENIYLLTNWGVLPFWLLLLFAPNQNVTKFFVHSVIVPLLLGLLYIFIAYQIYTDGNIFEGFNLYFGIENLYTVFSNEHFLLIFWIHFLSISLFIGSWISRDGIKYSIPNILIIISLVLTYFTGPLGLTIYWFIRIFFSKKINFNE